MDINLKLEIVYLMIDKYLIIYCIYLLSVNDYGNQKCNINARKNMRVRNTLCTIFNLTNTLQNFT